MWNITQLSTSQSLLHMSPITTIVIWPDPVSTGQFDIDLVVEVADVRVRLRSNSSKILVWEISLYHVKQWHIEGC